MKLQVIKSDEIFLLFYSFAMLSPLYLIQLQSIQSIFKAEANGCSLTVFLNCLEYAYPGFEKAFTQKHHINTNNILIELLSPLPTDTKVPSTMQQMFFSRKYTHQF